VESSQVMYATLGPNVFYFLSAPMIRLIGVETDPVGPSALEFRRKAAIEYLGQSLFIDREYGAAIAARVLAESPMPQTAVIGSLLLAPDSQLSSGITREGAGGAGAGSSHA